MKKTYYKLLIPLLILLLYLFLSRKYNLYIPCIFNEITNLYCPGCGATRMLYSLVIGNFYQAFRYNPLLFICIPGILILGINFVLSSFTHKKSFYSKIPNLVWIMIAIIFIIYGVIRNIPFFDYLIPTTI